VKLLTIMRAAIALTIAVAVVFQFRQSVDDAFEAVNFLSYFTIQSNVAAALLLTWEVVRPPESQSATGAAVRGAVTLYMAITFLVYWVLLTDPNIGGADAWVNIVLHLIAPVAVVVDWIVRPPRRLPGRSVLFAWLAWPLVFVTYSLIRGALEDWYPYPFLDPDEAGGYVGVAGFCLGILAAFVLVGLALHWWPSRAHAGRRRAAGA
jgi:hypothetical protein